MPRSPVLLAAIGIALLCIMDGAVKYLALTYPIPEVTFGRYVTGLAFTLLLWRARGSQPFDRAMLRFHFARGLVIALAGLGFFYAVRVLPIAEAITISFVAPLMIPFAARLLLGEALRPISLAAAGVGFAGVIVAEWGQSLDFGSARLGGVLAVLGGAIFYALTLVLLRKRAGSDGPARTGVLGSLMPAIWLAPLVIVDGTAPALADLPAFLVLGLLGTGGMWCLALAYARAQAQQIAPLGVHRALLVGAGGVCGVWRAPPPRPVRGGSGDHRGCGAGGLGRTPRPPASRARVYAGVLTPSPERRAMTCLCSQMFISALPSSAPV